MRGKKLFYLIITCLIASGLFGCGLTDKSKSGKALESGKESIASGDYDKAAQELKEAVESDSNNEPAKTLLNIVQKYLDAKRLNESGSSEEALSLLEGIDPKYKDYRIAQDIDALKQSISNSTASSQQDAQESAVEEKSIAILKSLEEQKYDQAQKLIDEMKRMNLNQSQLANADAFQNRLNNEKTAEEKAVDIVRALNEKKYDEAQKLIDQMSAMALNQAQSESLAAFKTRIENEKAALAAQEAANAKALQDAANAKAAQDAANQPAVVEEPYYGPSDVYDPYYYDDYYYDPYYYDPYYYDDYYYDDYYYNDYDGPSDVYDPYYDEYYY